MVKDSGPRGALHSLYRTRKELSDEILGLYENQSGWIPQYGGITPENFAERAKTHMWEANYREVVRITPFLEFVTPLVAISMFPEQVFESTTLTALCSAAAVDAAVRVYDTLSHGLDDQVVPLFAVGAAGKAREYTRVAKRYVGKQVDKALKRITTFQ